MPGGADSDKEIRLLQRMVNLLHADGHLAKPHHVRAQRRRKLTAGAAIVGGKIAAPINHLSAVGAARLQQLAVHMQHATVARALVQVVDILRHQQKVIAQHLLQLGQRLVRGVGLDLAGLQRATARVIKTLHQLGIAAIALRRCHILYAMLFPQAVGGAKRLDARLGRNARAGQNDHERLRMGRQLRLTIALENALAKTLVHLAAGLLIAGEAQASTRCAHKNSLWATSDRRQNSQM